MGVVIRQSLIGTITSYTGVALGFVNNILLFPMALSLTEIGLVKLFASIALLTYPFMQSGASQLAIKVSEKIRQDEKGNHYLNLAHLVFFSGIIIVSTLMFIMRYPIIGYFESKSPLIKEYYNLTIPMAIFFSIGTYFQILLSIKLKTVFSNFMKDVFVRLVTILLIVLYYNEWINQYSFFRAYVFVWGLQALIMVISYLSNFSYKRSRFSDFKALPEKRSLANYLKYIVIGSAGGGIVAQIDSIMSSSQLGLDYTGIYTIAFYIAILIEIPKRNITKIVTPLVSKSLQENDLKEVDNLYKKSALNQLIIGLLIFILILVNIENIYAFIPSSDKELMLSLGKPVVIIIGLSRILDMAMGCNAEIMQYSSAYKWSSLLIPFLAVLAILTNKLFLEYFNLELVGIALATLISIFIYNLIRFIVLFRLLGINPFTLKHVEVIIAGLIAFAPISFIPEMNLYLSIIIKSLAVFAIFSSLILWRKSSPEVNLIFSKTVLTIKKLFS